MYVVCIDIHVKPDHRAAFLQATLENARNTILEPGNLRFDVHQHNDDPNRFFLYEVYRNEGCMEAHKATAHYAKWRDTVAEWMAEPRKSAKYTALFPQNAEQWSARPRG